MTWKVFYSYNVTYFQVKLYLMEDKRKGRTIYNVSQSFLKQKTVIIKFVMAIYNFLTQVYFATVLFMEAVFTAK